MLPTAQLPSATTTRVVFVAADCVDDLRRVIAPRRAARRAYRAGVRLAARSRARQG